jgi:hypothetical protein
MRRCPKASSRRVSLATPDSVVPFSNVISKIYQDVLYVWGGKMKVAGLKVILNYSRLFASLLKLSGQ